MIDIFIDKIERHKRMIKTLVSDREQGFVLDHDDRRRNILTCHLYDSSQKEEKLGSSQKYHIYMQTFM